MRLLLPGGVIGALLGSAEGCRRSRPVPHRRWLIWTPMLFALALLQDLGDLLAGFDGGIGIAAVAVPAVCMAGGYGIAGRGPAWSRVMGLLVLLAAVPIWALTAEDVADPSMALGDPHGAWGAVLYWGLLATFSLAASLPHRRPGSGGVGGHDAALATAVQQVAAA